MPNFTPGPWVKHPVTAGLCRGYRLYANRNHIATAKAGFTESEANARLISKAPRLYEALKDVLGAIELHGANSREFFEARNAGWDALAEVEATHA